MKVLSVALTSAVMFVAMMLNFNALAVLGAQAGFGALSLGLPIIVDATAALATLTAVVLAGKQSTPARASAWSVLAGCAGISVAANMTLAAGLRLSPLGAELVSALPPLAAVASIYLLVVLRRRTPSRETNVTTAVTAAAQPGVQESGAKRMKPGPGVTSPNRAAVIA